MPSPSLPLHRLLRRQLSRLGIADPQQLPSAEAWQELLARVSRSYSEADQERYTLERSLQISGQEMQVLYDNLRNSAEEQATNEANKLRTIVNAIGDGLAVLDQQGRSVFINRVGATMLGLAEEELAGNPILESIKAGPAGNRGDYFYARIREEDAVRIDDTQILRQNGPPLDISLVLTPLQDSVRTQGAVLVFRDMTKAKEISEEILAARATAEAANSAKSEFLATMSHEIRTPMNGVLGMISLLRETNLTPQQQEYAETVMSSGNALMVIIDDILDFSKIEAGKLSIECIDFDLSQIVDEVVDLFSGTATARGLVFDCRIDPDVPPFVSGDPGRLRQVLANLLSNAMKFTRLGSVQLHVSNRRADDCHLVAFSIRDTGVGIPSEKQDLLFQAFSQTDSSTTRKFGGTGLGLAISRRLIEMMGGTIGVVSAPGSGSTFEFELPFASPAHSAAEPLAISPLVAVLVDGADTAMASLAARLEGLGADLHRVASLEAALAVLASRATAHRLLVLPLNPACATQLDTLADHPELSEVRTVVTSTAMSPAQLDAVVAHPRFGASLGLPARGTTIRQLTNGLFAPAAPSSKPVSFSDDSSDRHEAFRRSVLLVEDNPINQKVACLMLERIGHRVVVAANGKEAMAALQGNRFDVVLMDCQMPEMDGFEATRRIRAEEQAGRHLPIIAMTANAMQSDREQCLSAGMDDYLSKPVRLSDLASMLERWLPPG